MLIPNFIFQNLDKCAHRPALGVKHKGSYKTITFAQLKNKVWQFKHALVDLGVKLGDKIAIFSENRPEWVIADLGIQLSGAITVPIHSVFQPKYIKYVLEDSGAKILLISDNHLFEKLHQTHQDLNLKKIIYFARNKIFGIDSERFIYFAELLKPALDSYTPERNSTLSTQPASIVYTSGTTGLPKGVVLTHYNIISNIQAIVQAIPVSPKDRLLSFLPLSHIFERTAGCFAPLLQRASIFYAENYKTLPQDLKIARPTILIGVPRVFEKAYEKIQARASFHRIKKLPLAKFFLRKVIKSGFGGRMKFCVSGGAALDPKIGEFFQKWGLTILQGYGLTETSPVITCNRLCSNKFGSCGLLLENLDIKINSDKELLVKGPSVMRAYHNLPQKTKQAFSDDGYFKTGDLVKIDSEGFVYLIGRKKNIIVLSTGKNVQPEAIEAALDASPYINQVIVLGEGRKMVTALIVPEWDMFKAQDGWKDKASEIQEAEAYNIIRTELNRLLSDFPEHEKIKKFTLLSNPFSIDRDELTPTLKLKRQIIEEHYQKQIEKMYEF